MKTFIGRKQTNRSVCSYPKQNRPVSRCQTFLQMVFQIGQLPGKQPNVAERAALHDRSFNHSDDVASQLAGIRSPGDATLPCRCLQLGVELLGHLVETLGQFFPKAARGNR